jgi:hypothetical protein
LQPLQRNTPNDGLAAGWPFVVVVGINPAEGTAITYNGKKQNSHISYHQFLKASEKRTFGPSSFAQSQGLALYRNRPNVKALSFRIT